MAIPSMSPTFVWLAFRTSVKKIGRSDTIINDEVLKKKLIHETPHRLTFDCLGVNSSERDRFFIMSNAWFLPREHLGILSIADKSAKIIIQINVTLCNKAGVVSVKRNTSS